MNWKYSLAIHGTVEQIKEFTKELDKLGYKESIYPYDLREGVEMVLITERHCIAVEMQGYDYYYKESSWEREADYNFYLPQDHDVALALAAMQDTMDVEDNEMCVGKNTDSLYVRVKDDDFKILEWRDFSSKKEAGTIETIISPAMRKATAGEIIDYFKNKPMERVIIGYKCPYVLTQRTAQDAGDGSVRVIQMGTVFEKGKYGVYYSPEGAPMPPEEVEKWEPVYKEEEEIVERLINDYTLKISKKGVYVEEKNIWINMEDVRKIINQAAQPIRTGASWSNVGVSAYPIFPEVFKIGCTSGFTREDLEEVVELYDSLCKA